MFTRVLEHFYIRAFLLYLNDKVNNSSNNTRENLILKYDILK